MRQRDLFGRVDDPAPEQQELGGPSIAVGAKCPDCGRALITTESGWRSCPLAHGYLKAPTTAKQLKFGKDSIPVWIAGGLE